MVYGNCPNCGASYCRILPCQCDLRDVAQMTQKRFTKALPKTKTIKLVSFFNILFKKKK